LAPDAVSYSVVIKAILGSDAGELVGLESPESIIESLVQEMEHNKISFDDVLFNSLLNCLVKADKSDVSLAKACRILAMMKAYRVAPTIQTINSLLGVLISHNDLNALVLFEYVRAGCGSSAKGLDPSLTAVRSQSDPKLQELVEQLFSILNSLL
jgi:Pentatricopeptide repeat domain